MLRKLVSVALRRELPEDDCLGASGSGSARSVPGSERPDLDFPPMTPVRPPAAENDNPLAAFCAVVEADLRAAGYLR